MMSAKARYHQRNVNRRLVERFHDCDIRTDHSVEAAIVQRAIVLNEVRSCLKLSNYAPIRGLNCEMVNGTVVLHGTVPSYYLKQMAQELVCGLRLSQPIFNAVKVSTYETW